MCPEYILAQEWRQRKLYVGSPSALADGDSGGKGHSACQDLLSHGELKTKLVGTIGVTGGSSYEMWAAMVNSDGVVRSVATTGDDNSDQWLDSRVISVQKANAANAFSLNDRSGGISGLALSPANLYSAVQPGESLFGLQHNYPVDTRLAYQGKASRYGDSKDPMVGSKIGGVNVFGGGLGLYNSEGELVGAVGVSEDTSCEDHNVAWRTRDPLGLDFVPAGLSITRDDSIIFDISDAGHGNPGGASGFGHPVCLYVSTDLPK